jgi:hypothetical protein
LFHKSIPTKICQSDNHIIIFEAQPVKIIRTFNKFAFTECLLNKGMVQESKIVVFTTAAPVGVPGGANMIKVVRVARGD